MVRSMTGYGKYSGIFDGREITVEIKSVNHRFLELSARVPRAYAFLEEKLKSLVKSRISRGKAEIILSIVNIATSDNKISVNQAVAKEYVDALRELCEPLNVADDIRLSTIARFPDVFTVVRAETDEEQIWEDVKFVADKAVDALCQMRKREGENLKTDIEQKLCNIEALVSSIEQRNPQRVEEYRQRLYQKIKELVSDISIDNDRILTEVAIFADKVAVDEEMTRIKSHILQFRSFLESDAPVGKDLDFLSQEFNREANTTGSKCQDAEGIRYVIDLKHEIEKIREQIQNIL